MIIVAMLLSGCYQVAPQASQSDTAPATPTRLPNLRPPRTVVVDGSAIVGGIARHIALGFAAFTPGYTVQVDAAGTRDGFKLFCDDGTDVQGAIRLMDAGESADCTRNGVSILQITLAFDALAVVGDAPVEGCISRSELAFVYSHDTSALTWHDIRAALPSVPIRVFAPSADTAAAQFFAERVLTNRTPARADTMPRLIANGGGIGYLPLVEAQQRGGRLPVLAVDSGSGGCTVPSEQAIWTGSYSLLSRPLYLYINRDSLRRVEVFRFVSYALSAPGQQRIRDAGFTLASPDTYATAQIELDRTFGP
jgi:phosphate transport system substrate-binding protein